MGGLRERNKEKRRNSILDAALDILDDPATSPLTTERIAELAEVSVATVYNLVGTREQLLLALIDRLIANLVETIGAGEIPDDPLHRLRLFIGGSVAALTTRPVAYRRIVLQIAAAANAGLHTTLSPATAAAAELRRAQEMGRIRDELDSEALALQVYLSYNGALLRWAAGALTDSAFHASALHGLAVVVAASAAVRSRATAIEELKVLGPQMLERELRS